MADDNGGSITAEDLRSLCRNSDEPVITAREVAEAFDVSREEAIERLSELHESGAVERRVVEDEASVWWPLEG